MPGEYLVTLTVHPTYLHAKGEGPRTPENALRFFREAHDACMDAGLRAILLEMAFTGPGFEPSTILNLVTERSAEGAKLRRIAYVERAATASRAQLAETMAVNRGVNVRLFPDLGDAKRWLMEA
jgi:hypothetical protein